MVIKMKAARVNANLSQQEAAEALGISRSTLQNYEKGKTIPRLSIAEKIANVYGVSVDDIDWHS